MTFVDLFIAFQCKERHFEQGISVYLTSTKMSLLTKTSTNFKPNSEQVLGQWCLWWQDFRPAAPIEACLQKGTPKKAQIQN